MFIITDNIKKNLNFEGFVDNNLPFVISANVY